MAACWAASSSWAWENNTNPGTMKENSKENVANSDMGLMLGKRTYFEDHTKEEGTVPARSTSSSKKKQRSPPTTPTCQVEGCTADLSGSKGYHKRHRVCEVHSKTPKNIVGGIEQRFCQQCSRFHVLGEFDEGKRSCRRRLAGHNERRRKPPPPEPFAISPAILGGSSIYPGWSYGHKHLLDGTFISNSGSWPEFARAHQVHQIVSHPATANFPRLKQEMAGVYQFFKPEPVINTNPGGSVLPMPVPLEHPVGIVGNSVGSSGGALSLLSAEQWGSSPSKVTSSSADALLSTSLQFRPQISTAHRSGQLNDLVQYQKPLEATLAFDV